MAPVQLPDIPALVGHSQTGMLQRVLTDQHRSHVADCLQQAVAALPVFRTVQEVVDDLQRFWHAIAFCADDVIDHGALYGDAPSLRPDKAQCQSGN